MFENIAECEKLSSLDGVGYRLPQFDTELEELSYTAFWGGEYAVEGENFRIFAYEFDDAASAKTYFKNVTGKDTERDQDFSGSRGAWEYELTVIDAHKAYRVTAAASAQAVIDQLLEETFSVIIAKRG